MRRRDFLAGLASVAVGTRSCAALGQQAMPVIGFLNGTSAEGYGRFLSAFHRGLAETGYAEGTNVAVEYRWAEGHYERLPELAADLVRRGVTVIAATSTPANLVAAAATKTIPVVFTTSSDPVKVGLVKSLSEPGGNVTGAVTLNVEVGEKRLDLLGELIHGVGTVGLLLNPERPGAEPQSKSLEAAARALGYRLVVAKAQTGSDIDAAFAQFRQQNVNALVVNTDAFLFGQRDQIIGLTNRHGIPAIFDRREYVEAGGLMSYGGSVTDVYRLAGNYTGRILGGERPADLPVQQSTRLELLINLKAAKTLGLAMPPTLLAAADEVVE